MLFELSKLIKDYNLNISGAIQAGAHHGSVIKEIYKNTNQQLYSSSFPFGDHANYKSGLNDFLNSDMSMEKIKQIIMESQEYKSLGEI